VNDDDSNPSRKGDAMQTTQPTVAQTILQQLGGRRFLAMTGASDLVGDTDYLMFSLPRNMTRGRFSKCRITLNALDLYDIELFRIVKCEIKTQASSTDVYVEDLQRVFTSMTGLDTHL
jgi:hypothetical protein